MTDKIHLWPEDRTETGGIITAGVVIENSQGQHNHLWYGVPANQQKALTPGCDPFVLGTLFMAMGHSADLIVHGPVSPSLLRNLDEFQNIWVHWRPKLYKKIEITADQEIEQLSPNNSTKAVMVFSGGVDASFTAWSHQCGEKSRRGFDIQAGVMVHGFDIPLKQPDVFQRAAVKAAKMLNSLDMSLIPVVTNFRELDSEWEDCHGAGLASCLMLLQGCYGSGLIASSPPYEGPDMVWGSNPITDYLLSNDSFRIVHDGLTVTRGEKIRQISQWPEALQYLRVCWQGEHKDRNCGCCEKCIRTILNFRVIGLGLPECFERDVTNQQILKLKIPSISIAPFEELLAAAQAVPITDSWVTALEKCLLENKLRISGKQSFRQQFRKHVPLTLRRSIHRLIGKV